MSRTALLFLCLHGAMRVFAADIVQDGTFEAGGGAWSTSGAGSVVNLPGNCLGGSNFCGQYGAAPLGNIHQFVPTVTGGNYTVSFWLRNNGISTAGPDNSFHFQWGNVIPLATQVINSGGFNWTFFTTDVVADSNSTWVSFQGYNNTGTFLVDNITVDGPDGSVPEPSTWMLAGAALTGLFAALRNRNV